MNGRFLHLQIIIHVVKNPAEKPAGFNNMLSLFFKINSALRSRNSTFLLFGALRLHFAES